MKHFFRFQTGCSIALLISLASIQLKAQYGPFVGANTIILSTSMADKEAYQAIEQVLTDQSLSISAEKDILLIRSRPNSALAGKGLFFEGHLSINTGIIKLSGRMLDGFTEGGTSLTAKSIPVTFVKGRTSQQRLGFLYMDALARKLQAVLRGNMAYKYQPDAI